MPTAVAMMSVHWIAVVRDVAIVFGITFLGGFIVGFAASLSGGEVSTLALAVSNIIFGTAGFTISGCLAKIHRFRHLFGVAAGAWVVSLVNVALGAVTLQIWAASLLTILAMMGLGGAVSFLFVKAPKPASPAPTA
jgi:hypothetical protein